MRLFLSLLIAASPAFAGNVIYIGDSQSASDGTLLAKLLPSITAHNKVIAGNASCGTKIDDHLNGGPAHCKYASIQHMIASGGKVSFDPGGGHVAPIQTLLSNNASADTVIVELGDNHYSGSNIDAGLAKKARAMATKILSSGRKCIWIGPASIKGTSPACAATLPSKRAVSSVLQKSLSETVVNGKKCEFINSFELTRANPPPSDDRLCIHYLSKGSPHYGPWADAIRPVLEKALDEGGSVNSGGTNGSSTRRAVN